MVRAQALVLALTFQLCAPETETPAAGCTFEEVSDPAVPCEYSQAQYDDFQWEQVHVHPGTRSPADLPHGSYLMVNASQHAAGQRAHVIFQSLSENDTHCVQFSYFLYSRDGHSPGTLGIYVRVNGGPLGSAVWNMTGSHGRQWHQAELAVSTFWPNEYQVLFEALISPDRRGYMGLDDVLLLSYPCAKAPHFSRLGDVEVNAGQNASFQCMAAGRAAEAEHFLLQRQSGVLVPAAGVRHISHRRFLATFLLASVSRSEQDLYRCVSQAPRGAGVSNFAELIVKEPPTPIAPPQLLRAGPTYLIIQLNTNSIIGDGPIVRKEIEYRMSRGPWAEVHAVSLQTYKLWHLDPDTEYEISVLLTRPGDGGTGRPGPPLISRTKCAEPMRAPKGLAFAEIQARQLTLQWEPLGYNVTRCHTYAVSLCYHYTLGSSHNQTVRECVKMERGASRYTIKNLLPYRNVHVRLILANPEGRKEGKEVTFQTDEDVPGGIAAESLTFTPLEDMIFLKWEEPQEPNGLITQYEISYQSIESSDPAVNVPGPRRTISKLRNETYHVFSNLHPGTTYLFSVRARTGKGFGQAALTEITTNISAPSFDYADMPSPLGESENTITVLLRPAQGRGAPIRRDHYAYSYYPKPVNMTKATVNYRQEKTHMMSAVDRSFTDQSTLQEDERLGLSFMDTHGYSPRGDQRSSGVTEASSLLGGSPRRPCGRKGSPYHTGQLHPAVRVADLLQHINQMKTAEGYGFKQEYESFFEGWDATKKKDKVKGSRQEPVPAYDRHRVKLPPMMGGPDADSINANYIDIRINREGYHRSNHFIATQGVLALGGDLASGTSTLCAPGPKPEMVYDFWRMVWQEHCSSIVMITKLVEVGRVKCSRYWPEDSDMYGDIKITLVKTETLAEYVVRTFALERRGYSARHEVRQFHFTAWPEHGVPYHATGLLAFIRRVKASTPPDAGPVVIHCSAGTGRTGCYIVLDVMLDMAECEGVVDIYNCVKTLCSRRVNMIQTEEQYIFIHDAILEACLCGETTIPVSEFKATYKEMIRIDPQSNSSQLREEFQTLNSVTPPLDVEECSIALLPRNRDKNRSMDVLPPDRCLPFLISTDGDPNNYINAALTDSYTRSAAFIVTLHPLQSTTPDFWRLVYDYGCTSIVMLNQLHQSNTAWPCLQYWPEPGRQQYGLMDVEFVSGSVDEDLVARVFRVQNISRLQEGHLLVRHFQFLRWSAYRDTPDSKKAFLHLLAEVDKWQAESGDGRTVVHCLNGGGRSGTFCACATVLEMIRCHNLVDVFFAAKTLRNYKPNMVETLDQYHFCYDVALEYLEGLESR
ncbi:receptor-type tyrosine-protein phosphatase U isoform X9 [Mustela nigripes]|uniref:receptor-type tyrosine-protein phosphatase U isoform X9 n=1 Tax=Mustela lutreola TaxID=9666 RepID=UPI0027975DAC|nr:receptor-type tyrosine-protein phosphatase U isoform X9 [Mustela lutreola]XP_059232912.1 receptor-type tyrosine-protein phosphatase U isoform X9 [Mustela nigripes]